MRLGGGSGGDVDGGQGACFGSDLSEEELRRGSYLFYLYTSRPVKLTNVCPMMALSLAIVIKTRAFVVHTFSFEMRSKHASDSCIRQARVCFLDHVTLRHSFSQGLQLRSSRSQSSNKVALVGLSKI